MCRNRFQRMNAPKKAGVKSRNRCQYCGFLKRGHTCTARGINKVVRPEPLWLGTSAASDGIDFPPAGHGFLPLAAASCTPPTPGSPEPGWSIELGVERVARLSSPITAGFEPVSAGFEPVFERVPEPVTTPRDVEAVGIEAVGIEADAEEAGAEAEPPPERASPDSRFHPPEPEALESGVPPSAPIGLTTPTCLQEAATATGLKFSFPHAMKTPMPMPPALEMPNLPLLSRSRSHISLNMSSHPMTVALQMRSTCDLSAEMNEAELLRIDPASRENVSFSCFDLLMGDTSAALISAGAA